MIFRHPRGKVEPIRSIFKVPSYEFSILLSLSCYSALPSSHVTCAFVSSKPLGHPSALSCALVHRTHCFACHMYVYVYFTFMHVYVKAYLAICKISCKVCNYNWTLINIFLYCYKCTIEEDISNTYMKFSLRYKKCTLTLR